MSTDTLKPCPWCGGRALAYDVRETHGICTVECTGCNADRSGDTPELAAEAWNRRAGPPLDVSTGRELTGDVGRLAELMSDISEDCWCAGWMSCNEFSLWQMVIDPTTERRYGMGHVTDDQVAELKALSERTGGWVIWWDDFSDPTAPVETWGERFIPMTEWQTLWAEWEGRAAATKGTP